MYTSIGVYRLPVCMAGCRNSAVGFIISATERDSRIDTQSGNFTRRRFFPFVRSTTHGESDEEPLDFGARDSGSGVYREPEDHLFTDQIRQRTAEDGPGDGMFSSGRQTRRGLAPGEGWGHLGGGGGGESSK